MDLSLATAVAQRAAPSHAIGNSPRAHAAPIGSA
jgi:hypothetical protein